MLWLFALAQATPSFPSGMSTDLGMPCTPTCTVCHSTPSGGSGTATQPFAVALMSRGLLAYDDQSLSDALVTLEADQVDSNQDGVIDVEALRAGSDPNPNGVDFCSGPTPTYGCIGGGSALLLLPFAAFGLRRRF